MLRFKKLLKIIYTLKYDDVTIGWGCKINYRFSNYEN